MGYGGVGPVIFPLFLHKKFRVWIGRGLQKLPFLFCIAKSFRG